MQLTALRDFSDSIGVIYAGQDFDANGTFASGLIASGFAKLRGTPTAPTRWQGCAVAIIAGGPSVTEEALAHVRAWRDALPAKRKAIAINTSFRYAHWADVLYAADDLWWDHYHHEVERDFPGECWSQSDHARKKYGVNHIQCEQRGGMSKIPGVIHNGGNSGYQAIGLAADFGAQSIVLLGFDMQRIDGKSHHYGDHPSPLVQASPFDSWIRNFGTLAQDAKHRKLRIVNCSMRSALPYFPKVELSEALRIDPREQVYVRGMHGLGDNLHQRAFLKQLCETHEVWLETSWASIYHDLPSLHLLHKGTNLRTQLKNAEREASRFEARSPSLPDALTITYTAETVRKHGSILRSIIASAGCDTERDDFTLPIPAEWKREAKRLMQRWPTAGKPVLVYRPLVDRSEWAGCLSRNPDNFAYLELFRSIRDRFFVVSVADLVPNKEWIVSEDVGADVEYHGGELHFELLAALFSLSNLVWCSPGFALVLAQAVGTPSVCVFGGRENSSCYEHGSRYAPFLGIDPVTPCACFSHTHRCDKRIDLPSALEKVANFVKGYCS